MSDSRRRGSESLSNTTSTETTRHVRRRTTGSDGVSSTARMMLGLNLPLQQPVQQNVSDEKDEKKSANENISQIEAGIQNVNSSNNKKQYMYLISRGEKDMEFAAETWCSHKDKRTLIKDIKNKSLAVVSPEDTLYIHCHMYVDANHNPTDKVGGTINSKTKEELQLNSQELAQHLEDRGLNKNHKKLKLFCCYSESMQWKLYEALYAKGFNQIELSCYRGEVTLPGYNLHKSAGLSVEEAEKIMGQHKDENGNKVFFNPKTILKEKHRANTEENRVKINPQAYIARQEEQSRMNEESSSRPRLG
jgi:hypothetical protein